mgnify:CR=1 FL=1
MQIRDLKLVNFRNYSQIYLKFNRHLNIIIGNNGMGKTNLVEAIYVLALTKSFRTNVDNLLLKQNSNNTLIKASIENIVTDTYLLSISNDGKKVKINDSKIKRLSDYISKINVILFSPNDLRIIKDTPSIRRKMLNIEISQLNNLYLKYLQEYNQIIKQRNSYLKVMAINGNASKDYLDILTNNLIDIGLKINNQRKAFIDMINSNITSFYLKITGLDHLKIEYISDFNDLNIESLKKLYDKSLERDINFGKTHLGIHHDDINFLLKENNLKDYGSEGQQKNAIIAYKLSEVEIFKKVKKTSPILILDDLFSELDMQKIENILNLLDKEVQTFITTTDVDDVLETIKSNSKIIEIYDGKIKEDTDERSRT